MLTTIHITVRDRVPTITAGEDVISHNSDYVAEFVFDEEWQDKVKTVYFVCEDGSYQAVVMSGNSCDVPMMAGEHRRIFVGVQAGAAKKPSVLKTTRPCCLKVKDSIADYLGRPIPDPTPDVYEQIIAMLNNLTAPTWETVQNKPFSTLGDGLEVDENGVLSAQGGGASDNVRIIDATDDIWENGEHPLNMTTEEYQNILEWYRNQQSGVAKNILLNIDNRLVFQLVYIDGASMTFVYSNSGYNRYVKVSRKSNEVIATTSDIAGLTKSLMEASYLCNTGHKDDIIALFNMTTVGVIRGAGDSVPDNGKSIRYPALVFFGSEISYGNTYATLIDRNGVMWSIYIRLSSGVIELDEKTDYVTNTALTDILQGYVPAENYEENLQEIAQAIGTKLDKNQGATNAGKILGIGEDGIVVPQDKPTYTLTDADKTAVADEVVAGGIAATLADMPSGGGGGTYRLVSDTTLSEAVETITISQDKDGNAFELTDCLVWVFATVTEASQLVVIPNGYWTNGTYFAFANKTATDYAYDYVAYCHGSDDSFYGYAIRDKAASPGMNAAYNSQRASNPIKSKITLIKLNCKFAAGARILIYGR